MEREKKLENDEIKRYKIVISNVGKQEWIAPITKIIKSIINSKHRNPKKIEVTKSNK